jgi:hypothetical protein
MNTSEFVTLRASDLHTIPAFPIDPGAVDVPVDAETQCRVVPGLAAIQYTATAIEWA